MPVDPILAPFLPVPPLAPDIDFAAMRTAEEASGSALLELVAEPGPEVAERRVVTIPVPGGTIELAIYRPRLDTTLPVHVYLHGGGWVAGSALLPIVDVLARERAVGADVVVVAVNYRKAPEHPFPTPLTDCQAALEWVVDNAKDIGADPDLLTIGGGSAGATLAAALALKVRDERGPAITLQLLEVPALDLTIGLPSHADPELGELYALHRTTLKICTKAYIGDADPRNPYISPLHATDLTGLPPAYIMSAEFDLLLDDGELYAERLHDAGVPVTFSLQAGQVHMSPAFTKILPAARAWRAEAIETLRAANARAAAVLVSEQAPIQ